ncbi:MFS transporter [Candidatus Saccharibacteria bacterium]|nr:MFS transporter [Candidatus Saccharibacteria bacterium]
MAKPKTPVKQTTSAHDTAGKFTNRQRTIALIIVALAFVMDLLDTTIVNMAIPSIQADLGASYSAIQWLTAGYSLAFAVLLITGGRLGDIIGYKKMFLIGIAGFTATSLLCGFAWNIEVLVAARLLQGATAALMVPQVLSLMQVMYKPKERGVVLGIFGALAGVAASLGPVVGGLLIQADIAALDWRPIFLINIPVGIFAFFGAIRFLPGGKSPHPLKLDVFGTTLIIAALGLLIFPLIQGRELDWPFWIFAMMASSIPVFIGFWLWQLRKNKIDQSPLVIPKLFTSKTFSVGIMANLVFQMVMIGFFFTFTLILQIGLGYEVLQAALTGIPISIGISVSIGFIAQKLTPLIGRYTMSLGTIVMAIGLAIILWVFSTYGLDTQPYQLIAGLLITGIGMGLVLGLVFSVTLKDVDTKNAGSASGTLNAVQQLGGAIGVALVGVIFFGQLSINAVASFESAEPAIRSSLVEQRLPIAAQDAIIKDVKTCYVDRVNEKDSSTVPASCKKFESALSNDPTAAALGPIITDTVTAATANNFVNAFRAMVIYATGLLLVTFVLSLFFPRKIDFEMTH